MKMLLFYCCFLVLYCVSSLSTENTAGGPLFLTPFIEKNDIEKAKRLSEVESLVEEPRIQSYSGLFTVDKKYNSNIFFWFFPALKNPTSSPLLLWLPGGPGAPLLLSVFFEHGPYLTDKLGKVTYNPYTWLHEASILYLDNPVMTGYSFTEDVAGYARNQSQIADHVYETLRQFFLLFPEYKDCDFYTGGSSYGGKHGPSIAHKIHKEGASSGVNLKGVVIGNGYCHPEYISEYTDFLQTIGLIDETWAEIFSAEEKKVIDNIKLGKHAEAFQGLQTMLFNYPSLFHNATGLMHHYNYVEQSYYTDLEASFINVEKRIRSSLHVGNLTFNIFSDVLKWLVGDFTASVMPELTVIMDNYKVLFYSGQVDIVVPYASTEKTIRLSKWSGAGDYKKAVRVHWRDENDDVIGYVVQVRKLTEIMVRNAGHDVPWERPQESLEMIRRFFNNIPFGKDGD